MKCIGQPLELIEVVVGLHRDAQTADVQIGLIEDGQFDSVVIKQACLQ